jgi:predicted phosphodiesterase
MWTKYFFVFLILPLIQYCKPPAEHIYREQNLLTDRDMKFCLLGDLGMESDLQKVIADSLLEENCDSIFFLGDLIYPDGLKTVDDPGMRQQFLNYYDPLLENNPNLKIHIMLGNHDYAENRDVWRDLYKRNPRYFFPNYFYAMDYGGLCFVTLDTNFYVYKENLTEAFDQTTWLAQLGNDLKGCKYKVAMAHHPYFGGGHSGSEGWEGAEGAMKLFMETFINGKFDYFVAGHIHILQDEGTHDGTRHLISGTGGELSGDGDAGYVILHWNAKNGTPPRVELKKMAPHLL